MKLTIYFDGLVEPVNPGGHGCFGFVILDESGKELAAESGYLGLQYECSNGNTIPITNNIAEYSALLNAIDKCREMGLLTQEEDVDMACLGDSKLVVEQMSGNWKINAKHLQEAVDVITDLLDGFAVNWKMEWIPREQNERADQLSREAYKKVVGAYPPPRRRP